MKTYGGDTYPAGKILDTVTSAVTSKRPGKYDFSSTGSEVLALASDFCFGVLEIVRIDEIGPYFDEREVPGRPRRIAETRSEESIFYWNLVAMLCSFDIFENMREECSSFCCLHTTEVQHHIIDERGNSLERGKT